MLNSLPLKVTQYLRGTLQKKNIVPALLTGNYHKLYINRKVRNFEFGKQISCFGRAFVEKKEAGKRKTINCHSAESIGYQTQSVMLKNCTVLNQQLSFSQSVSGFSSILIGYLFIDTQRIICLPCCVRACHKINIHDIKKHRHPFVPRCLRNVRDNLPTLHTLLP